MQACNLRPALLTNTCLLSAAYRGIRLKSNSQNPCQYSLCSLADSMFYKLIFYPVHGANLTLIQPMWSAYPYVSTSLYGIHMTLLPYMVIQPIVLGMALLWAATDSALSQGPLLWRHNDMTVIVSRNTRGRERDTRQRLNNANARRLQTVNR